MMNDIYFDSSATMMPKFFAKDYYMLGNPNSVHSRGVQAHMALEKARQKIKDCLGVKGGKVLFCRCASEAVQGLTSSFLFGDKVCSEYEHDSVFYSCLGCDISSAEYPDYIKGMSSYGNDGFLYLHQYVSNITGSVFDIESIGKMCKECGAFFGSDFTAAIGHAPMFKNLEDFCDVVWFSGHKLSAEQGIGAIWVSDKIVENFSIDTESMFAGTPNVAGARAMADALEYTIEKYNSGVTKKLYADLVKHLNFELDKAGIPYSYVGKEEDFSNAINAITFPEMNADALVQYLSSKGIYISAGHSACSSDDPNASRVLEAFGLTKDEAEHTVRISFCEDNTVEEIDELVKNIVEFRNMFC